MKNLFNGLFGQISPDMARLSLNGNIAIKTSTGYKSYNLKKKKFVNVDDFAFDIGNDLFFVVPTAKVKPGDIVLINGKPKCVIEADKDQIKALSYEDGTIDIYLPERHVFLGNMYMYGKIISIIGNNKSGGLKGILKWVMMSKMLTGNKPNPLSGLTGNTDNGGGLGQLMMMSMLFGNKDSGFDFDNILDVDFDDVGEGFFDEDNDKEDEKDAEIARLKKELEEAKKSK